jgi:hypothetical protein
MPEITIHLRREPQLPAATRHAARAALRGPVAINSSPIGDAAVLLVNRGIAKLGDTVVVIVEIERDTRGSKTIATRPAWHTTRRAGVPALRAERP